MLSRVTKNLSKQVRLTAMATQSFKATTVAGASKKPSIGDAVTILQSKVSQINQVVSSSPPRSRVTSCKECPLMRRLLRGRRLLSDLRVLCLNVLERLERIRYCHFHR
jgi:hypothetical protein